MARTFKSDLSVKGLRELQKQLKAYKNVTLPNNVDRFVRELSLMGFEVAVKNKGEFKDYIKVERKLKDTKYNYQAKAVIIVFNNKQNIVTWLRGGTEVSAEVNSVMMAEYGSGQHAISGWRGTFPNQKHAFQNQWYWIGLDGEKHSSEGVHPSMPIYRAYVDMLTSIYIVGRRCFGEDE